MNDFTLVIIALGALVAGLYLCYAAFWGIIGTIGFWFPLALIMFIIWLPFGAVGAGIVLSIYLAFCCIIGLIFIHSD